MKILLYFESESLLKTSGIGRALKHQMKALDYHNINYTTDPNDYFDILHINTYGLNSKNIINKAKKENKPIVYHGHSTEEDFKNSFIFSNTLSPIVKLRLVSLYNMADHIITPTQYCKDILIGYDIDKDISVISNGIELDKYEYDIDKIIAFYKYFGLSKEDKIIISVGLYFERKGIIDFIRIAEKCPDITFIWFGYISNFLIPKNVQDILNDYPKNVILPGYVEGVIIQGAYLAADSFLFLSYEETEGIVVLEALASKQNIILRDIPVYNGWMIDKYNCYMGNNIDDFIDLINKACNKELLDLSDNGYSTINERTLDKIGYQLKCIYERLLNEKNKKNN